MKCPARRTRRLEIRPYRASDYRAWREAFSNLLPKRNRWDKRPLNPEDLTRLKFLELVATQRQMAKRDSSYIFGLFERKSGVLIGRMGVMDIQRGIIQSAYLGYTILNHHWGKGYGKEAGRAVIDMAFLELKLHRIEAGIEPANRRSILLARSLGLRKEGLKKRCLHDGKTWVDLVMYSATTEDFGIRWKGDPSRE